MKNIINKLSWAEQAFNEMDEHDMEEAEKLAINQNVIVKDEDGDYTDYFKVWYYKQVKG
jgi:hypothetical protein